MYYVLLLGILLWITAIVLSGQYAILIVVVLTNWGYDQLATKVNIKLIDGLEKGASSAKVLTRSREKSAFIKAVLALGLEVGQYANVSKKEWLDNGGDKQSLASQKNGPRYTLKNLTTPDYPNGIDCKAVNLSGEDLEAVAESENRELGESDVIYAMTKRKEE